MLIRWNWIKDFIPGSVTLQICWSSSALGEQCSRLIKIIRWYQPIKRVESIALYSTYCPGESVVRTWSIDGLLIHRQTKRQSNQTFQSSLIKDGWVCCFFFCFFLSLFFLVIHLFQLRCSGVPTNCSCAADAAIVFVAPIHNMSRVERWRLGVEHLSTVYYVAYWLYSTVCITIQYVYCISNHLKAKFSPNVQ